MTAPLGNSSRHPIRCHRRKHCHLDTGRSHRKRRQGVAGWRGSDVGGRGYKSQRLWTLCRPEPFDGSGLRHFTAFLFLFFPFFSFFPLPFLLSLSLLAWLDRGRKVHCSLSDFHIFIFNVSHILRDLSSKDWGRRYGVSFAVWETIWRKNYEKATYVF